VLTGSVELVAGERFGGVVANLESHLIRPLLPAVFAATEASGALLCSGILASERERFCTWIAQAGGTVDTVWSRHDWVGLRARVG
jgi:ribosomal protein L11 methylase PrmA